MTPDEVQAKILERLTAIEGILELHANPTNYLTTKKKAQILREAIATGSRKKINAAKRRINT